MSQIIVSHAGYGCESGCCGHVIYLDGEQVPGFHFDHPYGNSDEEKLRFAKELVEDVLGPEHVADLDWENCWVVDD